MTGIVRTALVGVLALGALNGLGAQGKGKEKGKDEAKGAAAAPAKGESVTIQNWFKSHQSSLPPGLSKKDALPPGLAKQLQKNGTLPPGLEKKIKPLPPELVKVLPPLPKGQERIIIGAQVVVMDRTAQKIVDLIDIILP